MTIQLLWDYQYCPIHTETEEREKKPLVVKENNFWSVYHFIVEAYNALYIKIHK